MTTAERKPVKKNIPANPTPTQLLTTLGEIAINWGKPSKEEKQKILKQLQKLKQKTPPKTTP